MRYQLGSGVVAGAETVILISEGRYLDLNQLLDSYAYSTSKETTVTAVRIFEDWQRWKQDLPEILKHATVSSSRNRPAEIDGGEIQWLPPLMYPRKLICIGTNYTDHIAEMGIDKLPKYPYSFLKPATTTLVGSGASVKLPEQAELVDWEVELGVVIGEKVRNVRGEEAMSAVAGYCVINDISARDWIADAPPVGIDWVMQKAFDGFTPMGPITPAEFVTDPQSLQLRLYVNGELKQDSTTANMVFSVQEIVEHLSAIMTLEPGDVIATGTPAGVGYSSKPPEALRPGDRMVAEVGNLGSLETVME